VKRSLRSKIIAWSFVPTAIILIAVAVVSLYAYQQVTEALVIERDRELIRLSAQLLANELSAYTDPFSDLFLTDFDAVIAFDEEGNILASEPPQYQRWGSGWLKNLVRERTPGSQSPIFSDIVYDGFQGFDYVVAIMPMQQSEGQLAGGIAGLFRIGASTDSPLYASVEELRRGASHCLYLVDGNGRVIYHSNPEYIGQDFSARTMVEMALSGWAGAYRTHDLEGREIVASFAPLPNSSWGLIIEESWDDLIRSSRRFGQILFALLALGVVVPTVIVTIGVQRITQPIARLIVAAQEIAGGHFGQRIEAASGDEIEELAHQFNLMAGQLQESYAHLEQKVADRTKELATLNTIAAEVSQSLDVEQILSRALEEVLKVMDMQCGQAYRLDADRQTLIAVTKRGLTDRFAKKLAKLPLSASLAGHAAEAKQPIVRRVVDYPQGEMKALIVEEGLQLVVSIPLLVHGECVGAMNIGTRTPRCLTTEEMSLLAAVGHQVGVAVENATLYEQAQELAVMKERNRLARDLHDSVTQALYGVTLYAEAAARQLASGETTLAGQHLHEIRDIGQESLTEMRLLIFELRLPELKQEGLAASLQARLEAVEGRVGLETMFHAQIREPLPAQVEEGLYRIAQEALNNTLKHAHATRVQVALSQNGRSVSLAVTDNGVGFDPAELKDQRGFGLRGMAERAEKLGAVLAVESSPGQGTTIRVEVSL
jgi:signal transduction histidine kinase